MLSMLQLVQNSRVAGYRVSVVNSKFSIVAETRNLCVRAALEAKANWLFFVDSDMVIPADSLRRLMSHERAVVAATYPRKTLPLAFIGNRVDGTPFSLEDHGLVEAGRIPAGCLLIKADVFSRLAPPYFRCGYNEEAGAILGEDFWFSDRVRELGLSVWCDMDLSRRVEHIGGYRFSLHEMRVR
jgi:hypothetical protein